MECELPLIGGTQGQHSWWTEGLVGSRRTRRNETEGWTTAKSVAQEGRKVKPILPTTPSRSTDRTTSRTNLTSLKPAEDLLFFFWFPSFPLYSLFLSVLLSFFIPSSFQPLLFYSFFLPSFIYSFVLTFVKIPSYLASDLSLFFFPSFLSFSTPFSLLPFFFFFCPPSPFSHRWDKKTWSAKKTRVRLCYTHKCQLKTSEHRRLRRQHHWIPLAFYHRSSYHKPRESE